MKKNNFPMLPSGSKAHRPQYHNRSIFTPLIRMRNIITTIRHYNKYQCNFICYSLYLVDIQYYSCTLVTIISVVYSSICCIFCDKCIAEVQYYNRSCLYGWYSITKLKTHMGTQTNRCTIALTHEHCSSGTSTNLQYVIKI